MKIGIVYSRYNSEFTQPLFEAVKAEILRGKEDVVIDSLQVPGAWEIPFGISVLHSRSPDSDAYIALGLVWQGATNHADVISQEVARSCMDFSRENGVPVIHQVLHVTTEEQAKERIFGSLNRPQEVAKTALEMAQLCLEKRANDLKSAIGYAQEG